MNKKLYNECDLCHAIYDAHYMAESQDSRYAHGCNGKNSEKDIYFGYGSYFDNEPIQWKDNDVKLKYSHFKLFCDQCAIRLLRIGDLNYWSYYDLNTNPMYITDDGKVDINLYLDVVEDFILHLVATTLGQNDLLQKIQKKFFLDLC
jgi:hypothetical protein